MLAKPMKYASLARLTFSLVSCIWSSGSNCKSCTECPGLQKCSANPGCVEMSIYNVSSMFVESVSYTSSRLSYVLAVGLFVA